MIGWSRLWYPTIYKRAAVRLPKPFKDVAQKAFGVGRRVVDVAQRTFGSEVVSPTSCKGGPNSEDVPQRCNYNRAGGGGSSKKGSFRGKEVQ